MKVILVRLQAGLSDFRRACPTSGGPVRLQAGLSDFRRACPTLTSNFGLPILLKKNIGFLPKKRISIFF